MFTIEGYKQYIESISFHISHQNYCSRDLCTHAMNCEMDRFVYHAFFVSSINPSLLNTML